MDNEELLAQARAEWDEDGIVSTCTYCKLNLAGLDPDSLIYMFESNQGELPCQE